MDRQTDRQTDDLYSMNKDCRVAASLPKHFTHQLIKDLSAARQALLTPPCPSLNPFALRKAKIENNFGHSECNRVKQEHCKWGNICQFKKLFYHMESFNRNSL